MNAKSNDFEVHPRGTAQEIALYRELAREIESVTEQYGSVVPLQIMNVYAKLLAHYDAYNGD
jgi:hypothetical protein